MLTSDLFPVHIKRVMDSERFTWIVFIMSAVLGSSKCHHSGCTSHMLADCFCGKVYKESEVLFTVNCTNLEFRNTSMLEQLPIETQWLIFSGNHITSLPPNVFGESAQLNDLRILDFSNNGINEIKGKSFHKVSNVFRLILNHNNITLGLEGADHPRILSNFYNLEELHLSNAFADNQGHILGSGLRDVFTSSNLSKLYKLHLEQNEIKGFYSQPNVFCDLPTLHDIYMGDNLLENIDFDLHCVKKLRYLDIEKNNISIFSHDDMHMLDDLLSDDKRQGLEINLEGNPFKCDQSLRGFYQWLHSTKVNIRHKEHLECHQSKYGRKYIMSIKSLAEAKHRRLSQAVIVLIVVLVFIIFSLAGAYMYLKKDKLRCRVPPILGVARKVQYTTIETQMV